MCGSHEVQVDGVPSQVLHEESHSTHLPSTFTLISAGHSAVQLLWKKKGKAPSGSQDVQEVGMFSQVIQFDEHGLHSFEFGFSINPSGHSTKH